MQPAKITIRGLNGPNREITGSIRNFEEAEQAIRPKTKGTNDE